MADIDYKLIKKKVRDLMKKHHITQSKLAEITQMSQPGVSKALGDDGSNIFTLDQIFRIAQHFQISIDELVGNKVAENLSISPPEVLRLLIKLLCSGKMRYTKVKIPEVDYVWNSMGETWGETVVTPTDVEYNAFYFQNYYCLNDFAFTDSEQEYLHFEFGDKGNMSPFCPMNIIVDNLLPIIQMYRTGQLAEEHFEAIVNDQINRLSEALDNPRENRIFEDRFLP